MTGQQPRTELLFYCFRLEDQITEDHLLKRLDRCRRRPRIVALDSSMYRAEWAETEFRAASREIQRYHFDFWSRTTSPTLSLYFSISDGAQRSSWISKSAGCKCSGNLSRASHGSL